MTPLVIPLTPTATDLTETRVYQAKLTMRFPADPDTTRRLQAVLRVDLAATLSWWRRVWRVWRLARLLKR